MKHVLIAAAILAAAFGCSSNTSKPWPDLHPVRGSVKVGGLTPTAGYITMKGEDAALTDFIVGGRIESDGTFTLGTTHALEKGGEKKSGVPAGQYKVRLMPSGGAGDQVTGASVESIESITPATVKPGDNNLTIEFPRPKK